jgi:hypothetical protein
MRYPSCSDQQRGAPNGFIAELHLSLDQALAQMLPPSCPGGSLLLWLRDLYPSIKEWITSRVAEDVIDLLRRRGDEQEVRECRKFYSRRSHQKCIRQLEMNLVSQLPVMIMSLINPIQETMKDILVRLRKLQAIVTVYQRILTALNRRAQEAMDRGSGQNDLVYI